MKLFGLELTRRELDACTGRLAQVAGIRLVRFDDGREQGMRVAQVSSGAGLRFSVLLDRGMDIGPAEFGGVPLAYLAPADSAAPAYFDDRGLNWLRTWGAGLLTGCGLRNVGGPCEVDEEEFPLHGRLSNIPATNVCTGEEWDGDDCEFFVQGKMTEARLFGENLELVRRVSTRLGGTEIRVTDTVTNRGFSPEPVFILYHTNWGFPVVHESSVLDAVPHPVVPRDDGAVAGLEHWMAMQPPTPGYSEQVFYHDIPADEDGFAGLTLRSPLAGLSVTVRCRKRELPWIVHWKMMGQGAYVTGIEPSNCRVGGRIAEIPNGPHCVLEGGDSRSFEVRISVRRI